MEFAAYSLILLYASHKTGVWFGSGEQLAKLLCVGERTAQRLLTSLRSKNYLECRRKVSGRGSYAIKVIKYNLPNKPSVVSAYAPEGVMGDGFQSNKPSVVSPSTQEVRLKNKREEASRKPLRIYLREFLESQAKAEALIGKGPEGKMQTKYDTLMQALRAGTAEPTKENLMRARNIVRSEFAFNNNERQLASEWLAKNSEAKTA